MKLRFTAHVLGNAATGNGSQSGDGSSNPPQPVVYSVFREERSGSLLLGDLTALLLGSLTWGNPVFKGITWQGYEVTTKSDALFLDAALSSLTAVDLDFGLRTVDGQVLDSSASATASERVTAVVQPNTRYILRVLGFANGPPQFTIVSDQLLPNGSPNANTTATSGGVATSSTSGSTVSGMVRFTVNPLTRSVTAQLLN